MNTSKLLTQGLLKLLAGVLMMGLVLFLPAGSVHMQRRDQGQRCAALRLVFQIPALKIGAVLFCKLKCFGHRASSCCIADCSMGFFALYHSLQKNAKNQRHGPSETFFDGRASNYDLSYV